MLLLLCCCCCTVAAVRSSNTCCHPVAAQAKAAALLLLLLCCCPSRSCWCADFWEVHASQHLPTMVATMGGYVCQLNDAANKAPTVSTTVQDSINVVSLTLVIVLMATGCWESLCTAVKTRQEPP